MKIKTQLIHVRSNRDDFEKEVQKVYQKAMAENVAEKLPEIQFSSFALGSNCFFNALITWFVK